MMEAGGSSSFTRELVVLGTASQVPTRTRNHNAFVLHLDGEYVLVDPGEGTQRQMTLAGISTSRLTGICLTHFHGDHCLGLPGVLQRRALDGIVRELPVWYPASGEMYLDRLTTSSATDEETNPRLARHPVGSDGVVGIVGRFRLSAAALDHPVPTFGWRFEESEHHHLSVEVLDGLGVHGREVGRLQREGRIQVGDRVVTIADVSHTTPGQVVAFILDTRLCDAAFALAEGADLVVCESTYADAELALATAHGHLTATQAARIASEAGARRLVLTHYSARYPDPQLLEDEARAVFPEVIAARDLQRIPLPAIVRRGTR